MRYMNMRRAIFLDRDGTLIEDQGYVHKIEDFRIFPGVFEGLRLLGNNYLFFIITNQPGIGKGLYTTDQFHKFNNFLSEQLKKQNIIIEKSYFCPHVDGCECKKPSTKYIKEIVSEFGINISKSWAIGDHPSDIIMGKNAGCETIYVLTGHGIKHFQELKLNNIIPTMVAPDFLSAAKYID